MAGRGVCGGDGFGGETMKTEDYDIRAVRDVRKKISAEFDNDPVKLVQHYLAEQEKYRDRLRRPVGARKEDDSGMSGRG